MAVTGPEFTVPPELLERLSALMSEENLPNLLEHLPEETRASVEKFAPLLVKSGPTLIQTVLEQMPHEQIEKIQQVVGLATTAAFDTQGVDPRRLLDERKMLEDAAEELAQQVMPTIEKHMADPEFIGKMVRAIATDGDSLKDVLRAVLGKDRASLVDPPLSFMSLGGTPVIENLDRMAAPGHKGELMDGPLRTLFLLGNMLAHSMSLGTAGSTFGPAPTEEQRAYPVVDMHLKEKNIKWLVPSTWMQGIDLVCSVLKLRMMRLEVQEDVLVKPDGEEASGAALYTVRMMLETETKSGKRSITVHSVRTGIGYKSSLSDNDLYLLMGLYEEPIRKSLGLGKYFSLADIVYKLGQNVASIGWLMELLKLENETVVRAFADFDSKRKELRSRLAEGIKATTSAARPVGEIGTVHVFAGVSLGGSIARSQAMVAKLQCERCPVVALTINSPGIFKVVHKLGLTPEDKRHFYEKWFSESPLDSKAHLFTGFVNFVAQHDSFWKLDDPLPGSKTCMYMHAAEVSGCRGVKDTGDLYSAAWSGLKKCRKEYVKAAEDYSLGKCVSEQLAPALGCIVQEHAFMLSGGLDSREAVSNPGEAIAQLNTTSMFADVARAFSQSGTAETTRDVAWLSSQTGYTVAVPLSEAEARERAAERRAATDEIQAELRHRLASVRAEFEQLNKAVEDEWSVLPSCTGCDAEWCKQKDIRQHRCCSVDGTGRCKHQPFNRTACTTSAGETCFEKTLGGIDRFVWNEGRRCTCAEGHCWDGSRCTQDASVTRRRELVAERRRLTKQRELQILLRNFQAKEKTAKFEAMVVKKKDKDGSLIDAKPDPKVDHKWICTR